jgi:hypothetical protein
MLDIIVLRNQYLNHDFWVLSEKKNDFCLKKSSENHATKHKPKITFKQGNRKSETKNNVYNHQNHATNL